MQDLGIILIACISIPLSTIINLVLLFPFPRFLKELCKTQVKINLYSGPFLSVLLFMFYMYNFATSEYDATEGDSQAIRYEAQARIWKLERNFHISLFNLANWLVVVGTINLLKRKEEVEKPPERQPRPRQQDAAN